MPGRAGTSWCRGRGNRRCCLPALPPMANDAHAVGDSGEVEVSSRCSLSSATGWASCLRPCSGSTGRGSIPSKPRMTTSCLNVSGGDGVREAAGRGADTAMARQGTRARVSFHGRSVALEPSIARGSRDSGRLTGPRRGRRTRHCAPPGQSSNRTMRSWPSTSDCATWDPRERRLGDPRRPLDVVRLTTSDIGRAAAAEVASRLSRVSSEDDDLSELVVVPARRLDSTTTDRLGAGFGEALATRTGLPSRSGRAAHEPRGRSAAGRTLPRLAGAQQARRRVGRHHPAGLPRCARAP